MKKLLLTLMAAFSLTAALGTSAAFAESSSWNDDDIMPLLNSLGIMEGDGNGDYHLDDYVSREEMAKIAVNSSPFKNETAVGIKVSPFKDIESARWSSPYILNGTQNGLINGYLDGTFRPYDMVKYEEAVTMMLKVLGYSEDDFGISYPYGQVNLADNIDLIKNVNSDYGCWMTRRQIARMVYNALNASMVENASKKLVSVFDAEFIEDAIVISTSNEDSSLGKNKVYTSSGKYNMYSGFNSDYVGLQGDMVIKNSKDMLCFVPDSQPMDKYVIYSLLNNAVIGYKNGAMTQIDINSSTTCYKGTSASTYALVKSEMEMGDILRVKYENDGDVDYIIYEKGKMEGPTKVVSSEMVNGYIRDASTQVMRDGNKVTASAVEVNDVIYYSSDLNMVLAYSTKVTGLYESASPSREQPSKVTISGKEYSVEGVQAFNDLSSSGPFKYGDTITVVLGKDGSVAGVVTTAAASETEKYGYVIAAGKKNFTNNDGTTYSSYYADIAAADGNTYEYATTNDCASYLNSIVKASFVNGKTSVTKVSKMSGLSGEVDAKAGTIGGMTVASDCKILDTGGNVKTDVPLYKTIYLQRLDGMNLTAQSVRYYKKNSNGEISELILQDATGDCFEYGIVTGGSYKTSYNVDIDGNAYTVSNSSGTYTSGIQVYSPCKAYVSGGSVGLYSTLSSYGGVSKIDGAYATVGGKEYLLSDKAVAYVTSDGIKYSKISINDVTDDKYNATAYYDKKESNGGRIRVIIARTKK